MSQAGMARLGHDIGCGPWPVLVVEKGVWGAGEGSISWTRSARPLHKMGKTWLGREVEGPDFFIHSFSTFSYFYSHINEVFQKAIFIYK